MTKARSYPDSKIYLVLPAFNEEGNIRRLIERIDEAMFHGKLEYQCLVVDDGSTDRTREIVSQLEAIYPITPIYHPHNMGLGATLKTGLKEAVALAQNHDIVVTMDADDTHLPGLILRMTRMLREGYEVVIASRFQPGSQVHGVSLFRQLLSIGASFLFRVLFPIPGVKDYTCGFRAYKASLLKEAFQKHGDAFLSQEGFQCMVDILLWLRKSKTIIGEVPMVLRYDFKEGQSKMKVAKTIKNTLKLVGQRLGER